MQNKIKATKPRIIVKARIKFAHALKKTHSIATSLLGSIIHKLEANGARESMRTLADQIQFKS